jgi:hypothetical protein
MADNEEIEENIEEVEAPLTKPKRQRTQKQMEAFEKVKQKRKADIELKKQEKLINSAKVLIEEQAKKQSSEVDSDGEEEEIIVVRKPRAKPKPKPKKNELLSLKEEAIANECVSSGTFFNCD